MIDPSILITEILCRAFRLKAVKDVDTEKVSFTLEIEPSEQKFWYRKTLTSLK